MRIWIERRRRPDWQYADGTTRPVDPWIRFGILHPVRSIYVLLLGPIGFAIVLPKWMLR